MYLKAPILSDYNEIQIYSAVVIAVHEAVHTLVCFTHWSDFCFFVLPQLPNFSSECEDACRVALLGA